MRICDLAKELMTTGKELLQLLQARGCTARSTQAKLTPELEQFLRSGSDENEDTPGGERGAAHHADDSDDSDGSPNRPQAD